jgi:tRNA(Ile)-lysidine synthase
VWTNLHAKLHQTLIDRQLLPQRSKLLVGLSGGQDSLCLLKLLADLRSRWHWEIKIAHCDHGWAQDVGIAAHVSEIACNWDLPIEIETAVNLPETEAAARSWRYRSLVKMALAADCPYIITAHTQTDRAETLLYNLIRGAGADGLSAMTWVRELESELQLVRPLLAINRVETREFCDNFKLPIWVDVYNHDLKYARVRLRESIMPQLRSQFHPQVEAHLARTAELLRSDVEYLEELAQTAYNRSVRSMPPRSIDRQFLQTLPLSLQRRTIRIWLSEELSQMPNFKAIESIVNLINAPQKSRTSSLSRGIFAEVYGNTIKLH